MPTATTGLVTVTPGRSHSCHYWPHSPSPTTLSSKAETQQPLATPSAVLSPADTKLGSTASNMVSGGLGGLTLVVPTSRDKKVIATKLLETVKWFNVRNHQFINRNDTKEDIFVHQMAIKKNKPRKYLPSIGDGETGVCCCCIFSAEYCRSMLAASVTC